MFSKTIGGVGFADNSLSAKAGVPAAANPSIAAERMKSRRRIWVCRVKIDLPRPRNGPFSGLIHSQDLIDGDRP